MGYTRRQELHCTETELKENPSAVLYKGERLLVTSDDGNRILREIIGDGKTQVGELSSVIDYDGTYRAVSSNRKMIENLKKGYNDAFYATQRIIINTPVPMNALPYAEINKLDYEVTQLISYDEREKEKEPLSLENVGTSEYNLSVEKLEEGVLKISGYTEEQGQRFVKIADISTYLNQRVSYKIISDNDSFDVFELALRNGDTIRVIPEDSCVFPPDTVGTTGVELVLSIGTNGGGGEWVVRLEMGDDEHERYVVDTYTRPQIEGAEAGVHYIDFDEGMLVNKETLEKTDIRKYIEYDNFIKVSSNHNGLISVDPLTGSAEVTFMLKGE